MSISIEKLNDVYNYPTKEHIRELIMILKAQWQQSSPSHYTGFILNWFYKRVHASSWATEAYIYVASPADPPSSATSWARLGLSLSSGQYRTDVAPEPLETGPANTSCYTRAIIRQTREPSAQIGRFGIVSFQSLTWRKLDLQGRADQGHQGGGEMDRVVVRYGHVHLHQSLKGTDKRSKQFTERRLRRRGSSDPNSGLYLWFIFR